MSKETENLEASIPQEDFEHPQAEASVDKGRFEQAELYIATVRLIDTVTKRGSFEGGELLVVGAIRQKFVDWLVQEGFIQESQGTNGAA